MKIRFNIKGLDCANCASGLERAIQKIEGIEKANISFITQKMEIECNEIKREEIIKSIIKVIKKEEPYVSVEEI